MKISVPDLHGKTVLITGASSGLGEQIAYEVAVKGATVIVTARRENLLEKVREKCAVIARSEAYAYPLDVSDPEQIVSVVEQIHDEIGKIDILINNAGFGYFETAINFDMAVAEKMFRVNVLGMMYLTQLVAEDMLDQENGHIINVASQAGKMATPKSATYSATKAAVIAYSNALRLEVKPFNVYVTTINPGPIETGFFDIADPSGDYLQSVNAFVLNSEYVAERIIGAIGRPKREVNVPYILEVANKLYTLFPSIGDYIAANLGNKK